MKTNQENPNLVFVSKEDAEKVLTALNEVIERFAFASLGDLYDLVGLPSSHVNNKFGWTTLVSTEIHKTEDGYLIDFPELEAI